jgi:hypothetical protein
MFFSATKGTMTGQLDMGAYAIYSSSAITAASYQINGSTVVAILPGVNSIAYGVGAGVNNIPPGGDRNTFIGNYSGALNTTGSDNTFLGWQAGYNVTSGTGNIVVGYNEYTSAATANNELNVGGVLYGNLASGTIGISTRNPQAALDVVSTGTLANQYAQIWRASDGTIVSSMTATGVLYPQVGASVPQSITVSTINATAATPYGGVHVTTNIFITDGVNIGAGRPNKDFKLYISSGMSYDGKIFVVSDTLRLASDTERSTSSSTPVLIKKIKVAGTGSVRLSYEARKDSSGFVVSRVFVNGIALSTGTTGSNTGYLTYSYDIHLPAKQTTFEFYLSNTFNGYWSYIRNARLYWDEVYQDATTAVVLD